MEVAMRARGNERLLADQREAGSRQSARRTRQIDQEIQDVRNTLADTQARTGHIPGIEISASRDTDDHLGAKTKHNMELSRKLSHSLEVLSHKRGTSPHGGRRPVSPAAMEELEKAAIILRGTPHAKEVEHLMASVMPSRSLSPTTRSVSPAGRSMSPSGRSMTSG